MENRHLFRGKRIDNGEWIQGYLYGIWERRYILWGMTNDIPNMVEVDPETVCQCTGPEDKNGKLIFENDIVKGKYFYGGKSYRHIGQVEYVCQSYKVVGVNQYSGYHSELDGLYEVIGNVFDNPELLKGVSYDGE